MQIREHIEEWVAHLSKKQILLGGFSACPYVGGIKYEIIETDGSDIKEMPEGIDAVIYVLPTTLSQEELKEIANKYNQIYEDLVFLTDHKDKNIYINTVQTNNKKLNLIISQWKKPLEEAQEKLSKSGYYVFWSASDILGRK